MPKLYELTDAYRRVLDLAEGDEIGGWDAALSDIKDGIVDKAQGIAKVIKMLETDAAVALAEAERLTKLATTRTDRVAFLKRYLREALEATGIDKADGPLFKIRLQTTRRLIG